MSTLKVESRLLDNMGNGYRKMEEEEDMSVESIGEEDDEEDEDGTDDGLGEDSRKLRGRRIC